MNLVADESVDGQVVASLRHEGHHVAYVAEFEAGVDDETVLARAVELGALLVTADKDFGELVFRQGKAQNGVILLRLAGLPAARKSEILSASLQKHGDSMARCFTVVTPGILRMRRPPSFSDA